MPIKPLIRAIFSTLNYDIVRKRRPTGAGPIKKPTDTSHLEILLDESFQNSIDEVRHLTLLDTARLANLWQLCKMSNPAGSIIEIGSYKGGSALHMSNSCPNRRIFICDTFEGFGRLPIDSRLDRLFSQADFSDTNLALVQSAWKPKDRYVTWVKGYFPQSAASIEIRGISFAHIDVDLYQSTFDTLEFLNSRFIDKSLILFDDYLRGVDGVMKATKDFLELHPEWICLPIYPGQGLMIHQTWFGR